MICPLHEAIFVNINNERYALRPTLGAMHRIEKQTGLTIPTLIAILHASSNPPPLLLGVIFYESAQLAGYMDETHIGDEALYAARASLCTYLLRGIGYVTHDPAALKPEEIKALQMPDWRDLFKTAVGFMGRPMQEFWQMTLGEYMLALEGFCMLHGIDIAAAAAPATAKDLMEMMQRFPDKKVEGTEVV